MKREIDITMLMDSYTDNEFNIGGEAGVDADKVLSAVMPKVKKKKKIKPLFKLLMASAAATVAAIVGVTVVSSSLIGNAHFTTALGARVDYEYGEKWEGGDIYTYSHSFSYWPKDLKYPAEETDGRLYFTADGQNVDITDIIDRKTPYIYTYIVPQTSLPVHIIMGGDPGEVAYVELMYFEGYGWFGYGYFMDTEEDVGGIRVSVDNYERYEEPYEKWVNSNYRRWTDSNGDGEQQDDEILYHDHDHIPATPDPSEEDCPDAWILSALRQLDLL